MIRILVLMGIAAVGLVAEPMPLSTTASMPSTVPVYHDATAAEADVYAAYLGKNYKASKNDGPLARTSLILENESVDVWYKNRRAWEAYLVNSISGPGRASTACIQAFLHRPQQTLRFFQFPATQHTVKLVRSDELQKLLLKGWDHFYESYPGSNGYLSFGVIGWSPAHDEALFTVATRCGSNCGYRDLVYMQTINDQWEIVIKESLP
jgi:hypothetical protein